MPQSPKIKRHRCVLQDLELVKLNLATTATERRSGKVMWRGEDVLPTNGATDGFALTSLFGIHISHEAAALGSSGFWQRST